jgi:hypothetical protein
MTKPHAPARYRAATMELVAYLDERQVEMHIVTASGESITVACARDSIFKVQRSIERMRRECPEIATWGDEALPAPVVRATHRPATRALMPAALAVLALLVGGPAVAEPLADGQRFQFEPGARRHCPADTVVWVNTRTQIYNSSDERWYGQTIGGAFVCKLEAEKAGYRGKSQL